MPVHYALDEERLVQMGLHNYWGYNSIAFFCLDPALASQREGAAMRDEFRGMVRTLHKAGIEVLLDVVYNHTAEGDGTGPTVSFRGLAPLPLSRERWHRRRRVAGLGPPQNMRIPSAPPCGLPMLSGCFMSLE